MVSSLVPNKKPLSIEAFGGKVDYEQLNPVMKQLMKSVLQKTGFKSEGSVDTRDWDFIESWAIDLRDKLNKAA